MRFEGSSELCSRVIYCLWPESRVHAAPCCPLALQKAGLITTPPRLPLNPPPKKAPVLESEKSAQCSRALSSTDRQGSGVKARGKTELPVCLLPLGTHPYPAFYIPLPRLRSLVNKTRFCPSYQHTRGYQQHLVLLQQQRSGPCCAEICMCMYAAPACKENS